MALPVDQVEIRGTRTCRYCRQLLVSEFHYPNCPRAPWRIQPGWQAVALVSTPWWRRLLRR